jgi:hypothetical protein
MQKYEHEIMITFLLYQLFTLFLNVLGFIQRCSVLKVSDGEV